MRGRVKIASRTFDSHDDALPRVSAQRLIGAPVQIAVGVLLVAVAGCVDAIGYIALGGFFASFMSGASISLGVGLSEGQMGAVYEGIVLIAAFLAGAIVGTVTAGIVGVWALPTVLLLESGLLVGAVLLTGSGWDASVSILPVVAAMGVQNTALRPVNGVRVGVTFMTGTLISLGQGVGRALLGRSRRWSWSAHAVLWCAFCAGAAAGAFLYAQFGFGAVSVPAVTVGMTAVIVLAVVYFKQTARTRNAADRRTRP